MRCCWTRIDKATVAPEDTRSLAMEAPTLFVEVKAVIEGKDWTRHAAALAGESGVEASEDVQRIVAFTETRLGQLQGLLDDVGDDPESEPDLRAAVVYWYIEAKAQWCQFNQRLNYQMMLTGMPDMALMVIGAIGTAILQDIESLFQPSEIEALTDILAAPIETATDYNKLKTLQISDGHCEIPIALAEGIQQTLLEVQQFQFKLDADQGLGGSQTVLTEYGPLVKAAQSQLAQLNDFNKYEKLFRRFVQQISETVGVRIMPCFDLAQDAKLDLPTQKAMIDLCYRYLGVLAERGLEKSAEERIAKGKPGYVDVKFRVYTDGRRITLELKDNGVPLADQDVVTEQMKDAETLRAVPGATLEMDSTEEGNCIRATFPVPKDLSAKDYLEVAVGENIYAVESSIVDAVVNFDSACVQASHTTPSLVVHGVRHDVFGLVELIGEQSELPVRGVGLTLKRNDLPTVVVVDAVVNRRNGVARPLGKMPFETASYITGYLPNEKACSLVVDLKQLLQPETSDQDALDEYNHAS